MSYVSLLEITHPVGSLWFSYDNTSPANIVGGTWTQVVNKVIRAGNDTNAAGADTHTLSVNEMPAHHHYLPANSYTINWGYLNTEDVYFSPQGQNAGVVAIRWTAGYYDGGNYLKADTQSRSVQSNGSSVAHNNLPAYQNIYIWRRTN